MIDFEVHPIGTTKEIRLSRKLVNELLEAERTIENGLPEEVLKACRELQAHYNWQIEMENL